MLASITQSIGDFVGEHGFWAIFGLMAVDAVFPAGSEIIMVVAGAVAARAFSGGDPSFLGTELSPGFETYFVLALGGTVGYLVGAIVGWIGGRLVGHEVLLRYGRYIHLGPGNLEKAERWFARYGGWAVLIGRITPLARSFVSVPAGTFGEPFVRYVLLTTLGSAIWCFAFAGAGWALGANYDRADTATHVIEVVLAVGVVIGGGLWLLRRRRHRAAAAAEAPSESA